MTNDFPGTKLPDLSKLPATDREKQIAAEYSRISTEDTVPILVAGRQSFQLGGLTGLGDDQANWTCWMLAKAIQKIEDAVYDKIEAAIAKDLEDIDPNIVLMEAEARDRERIHVTDTSIWGNPSANIALEDFVHLVGGQRKLIDRLWASTVAVTVMALASLAVNVYLLTGGAR